MPRFVVVATSADCTCKHNVKGHVSKFSTTLRRHLRKSYRLVTSAHIGRCFACLWPEAPGEVDRIVFAVAATALKASRSPSNFTVALPAGVRAPPLSTSRSVQRLECTRLRKGLTPNLGRSDGRQQSSSCCNSQSSHDILHENHATKVNRAKLASSAGGNIRFAQNRASSPLALFKCH
jgi:hypothetical protein